MANPLAPPCGSAGCSSRATHADGYGVGFCEAHKSDALGEAVEGAAFDPWWAASSLAIERGDPRWAGLEYGEWPVREGGDG